MCSSGSLAQMPRLSTVSMLGKLEMKTLWQFCNEPEGPKGRRSLRRSSRRCPSQNQPDSSFGVWASGSSSFTRRVAHSYRRQFRKSI